MSVKRMDCVVTINLECFKPFFVLINNMHCVHSDVKIHWWLLEDELSEDNIKELEDYAQEKNSVLHDIHMNPEVIAVFNVEKAKRWCKEILYRLFIPYILPENVERVMLLGMDVTINEDIYDYYSQDFKGKLCMVVDSPRGIDGTDDREKVFLENQVRSFNGMCGRDEQAKYFGVDFMVFNIVKFREMIKFDEIKKVMCENNFTYPEQDLYNYVLTDDMKLWAPDKYVYFFHTYHNGTHRSESWVINNAKAIHYGGGPHPWTMLDTPMKEVFALWWKYAEDTPYYEEMYRELPEKITWAYDKSIKFRNHYNTLNLFLRAELSGNGLDKILQARGWNRVVLYGYGEIGKRVYEKLTSSDVEIVEILDKVLPAQNDNSLLHSRDEMQSKPDYYDVMLVTVTHMYRDIASEMRKKGVENIVSLADVLREA